MSPNNKKRQKGGARVQSGTTSNLLRTRRWQILRVLYIILTVISALVVAGFIFWHFFSAPPDTDSLSNRRPQEPTTTTIIDENGNEVEVDVPELSSDRKNQFYTFLLVGQDTLGGGNTDTMMLVAYDVPNQTLNVMSLPRDTYVEYAGRKMLLNAVYNWAGGGEKGIEALKQEVGDLTGVIPDYHVIIQWEAVGELVDAIGGVYFDVPQRMYYNDLSQGFKIDLQAGYQLLDGEKAMQLIRYRMDSDDNGNYFGGYAMGDLGRIQTQQAFMKAVIAKCLQPGVLLPNLTEYIRIFQANVETNLTYSNMAYFAKSAVGKLDMDNVEFVTMPYKSAGAHLLPVASEILELINENFNPYQEDIRLSELDVVTSAPGSSSSGSSTSTGKTSTETTTSQTTEPSGVEETEPSPTPGEKEDPPVESSPAQGAEEDPFEPGSAEDGGTEPPSTTDDVTPNVSPEPASGPGMEPVE